MNAGEGWGTILSRPLCCYGGYKSCFLSKAVAIQMQIPDQRKEIETSEATVTI